MGKGLESFEQEVRFESDIREARRPGIDLEYGDRTHAMFLRNSDGVDSPLMPYLVKGEYGNVVWNNFEERVQALEDFFTSLFPNLF